LSHISPEVSNVFHFDRGKLTGRRILIVEDEMLIAFGLIDIVASFGAAWVSTARVAKALALVASEPFDAAILDMKLAGEPADAVLDALMVRDVPFIITTGYGAEGMAEKYRTLPRLPKPYSPEQIKDALLNVLSSPEVFARCG
jgi:DNA-binding NtrC family response regulator